jgi:hypothetical protein
VECPSTDLNPICPLKGLFAQAQVMAGLKSRRFASNGIRTVWIT